MGLFNGQTPFLLGTLIVLFFFTGGAHAFGAGNVASISKVEGENWRHGDIEDVLLKLTFARAAGGKKFNDINVARVYFGNWLRDYSQAIDIGTVKSISAEAIRLLLSVLGFMTFGYGSREFEVTAERLGCYRPEDHIDNPKGYGEGQDPRQYDRRLRGPIDERVELAIDQETGMKNYIANERVNIMTSALHLRRLFGKCIELGRSYGRSGNKAEKYEALRLMGTGLHCLEDFLAHSNYLELALIEMGERDVFPHVGRRTRMRLQGARDEVYPIVTGTFGGVDFLASITGEVSDKLTQNEVEELEGTLQECKHSDTSILESLLDKIPDGIFGGSNKKEQVHTVQQNAQAAQVEQMSLNPREPEELTKQVGLAFQQLQPVIQTHDEIIQGISTAIDKVPVLPKVLDQLEEQLSVWVFSLMAPFVVPVLQQVKNELRTGSSEIVESSKREQHIVFHDDNATDPTHTMLSKDHFSNILNEPAGKTAAKVVEWVVPQLMQAWDDDNADVDRVISRIIHGVLHHPAQRGMGDDGARDGREIMFRSVEEWWHGLDRRQQDDLRRKLSRDGIERGENNKPGVHDCGHGSGKPLKMHKQFGKGGNTLEDRIATNVTNTIMGGVTSGVSDLAAQATGMRIGALDHAAQSFNRPQQQESGGGGIGGFVGSLLGGGFKGEETETHSSRRHNDDEGYTQQMTTQYGRNEDEGRYGEAQYRRTEYDDGRSRREEYSRYEENEGGGRYQQTSTYESSTSGGWGGNNQSNEESGGGGGGNFLDDLVQTAQNAFGGSERRDDRRDGGWN